MIWYVLMIYRGMKMKITPEQLEREATIKNAMNKIKDNCKKHEARQIKERLDDALFNKELNQINKGDDYE